MNKFGSNTPWALKGNPLVTPNAQSIQLMKAREVYEVA